MLHSAAKVSGCVGPLSSCKDRWCVQRLKSWTPLNKPNWHTNNILIFIHVLVFKTNESIQSHMSDFHNEQLKMMNCPQVLYKVRCQGSHFVFGFFRIGPPSPASSPSTSPGTTAPRVPHGGMFELHKILEDGIAENTARMLRLTSWKWSTSLVEVYRNESGIAGITALLSDLHGYTSTLESAKRIKPLWV